MRVVVAPDAFKGNLSAIEVCHCFERGVRRADPAAIVDKLPMSDGGEGLVEVMAEATGGTTIPQRVQDPLGRDIDGFFGLTGDGRVAVIEMAAASGLPHLRKEERNPLIASTYGTGQLIRAALDRGVEHILVGIGGSATVDGGAGMAMALGAELLDGRGRPIAPGGGGLADLGSIRLQGIDARLANVRVEVACDVDNPLTGPNGAARIYGPQKGADPEMVEILDANLSHLAQVIRRELGREVKAHPGAGAAGGLGAGMMAFCNGTLRSGIDLVLDHVDFDARVVGADLVLTGEGRLDGQSLFGKTPVGVSQRAGKLGCPAMAIAGCAHGDLNAIHEHNIVAYFAIDQRPIADPDFADTPRMLARLAEQAVRAFLAGRGSVSGP